MANGSSRPTPIINAGGARGGASSYFTRQEWPRKAFAISPLSFVRLTDRDELSVSAPSAFSFMALRQSRQFPSHTGDAPADQGLVADELREKLIKIGAKVVSHGRYVAFQMAEVAVPRHLFVDILRLIVEFGRRQSR